MTTRRQIITGTAATVAIALLPRPAAAATDPLPGWSDEGLRNWITDLPDRQREQANALQFLRIYQEVWDEEAEAVNHPVAWKLAADNRKAHAQYVHEDIPMFNRITAEVRQAMAARGLA